MIIETPSGGPPPLPSPRKTDSTWMAIGRFARSAPWTSTGASLLVLAAVGVLAGVDPLFIRILLTWSLGLLAAAWVLLWLVRRADNSTLFDRPESGTATAASKDKATSGSSWGVWGAVCLVAVVSAAARQQSRRPYYDPKPQLLHVERREATSRHWNAAVTRLHKIRFDQSVSDSISASDHSRQAIELLRVGLGEALSASTEKVDPDLLRMTQRHLKVDQQSLAVIGRIKSSRPRAEVAAWVRSDVDNRWNAYDPQVSTGSTVVFFRLPLGGEPVGGMAGFESSAPSSVAAAWFRSR